MFTTFAALALTGLSVAELRPHLTQEGVHDAIVEVCAIDYPEDFVLQRACRSEMIDGALTWWRAFNAASGDDSLQRALLRCAGEFMRHGRVNWILAGACGGMQAEARGDLEP